MNIKYIVFHYPTITSLLSSMWAEVGIPSPSKNPNLVINSCAAGEQLGSLSGFASDWEEKSWRLESYIWKLLKEVEKVQTFNCWWVLDPLHNCTNLGEERPTCQSNQKCLSAISSSLNWWVTWHNDSRKSSIKLKAYWQAETLFLSYKNMRSRG